MHDIGELNVRRSVLDKSAPLDEQERAQICEHTTVGARWLASVPGLAPLVPFARWHHERFDGQGYPDSCSAERVPLTVALVAVCDAWHAMRFDRPYRKALSRAEALHELARCSASQFDPGVVRAFIKSIEA